jgi:hypothetical protein
VRTDRQVVDHIAGGEVHSSTAPHAGGVIDQTVTREPGCRHLVQALPVLGDS